MISIEQEKIDLNQKVNKRKDRLLLTDTSDILTVMQTKFTAVGLDSAMLVHGASLDLSPRT